MTLCEETICSAWSPPSDLPAWKWVEAEVELGNDSEIKGKVSFDWVPMSRFVLDKCQSDRVRSVAVMVSAQSAKTKTFEFYLMWMVKNRPSETIWYQDDNVSAKTFFKTRLLPDLEDCEAIAHLMPVNRSRQSQTLIQFDSMNLYVLGANSKKNRERITAGTVMCDEVRNYAQGAMAGIRNRYKTVRNYKELLFSTAGTEGDELHSRFEDGTRHLFLWACPSCRCRQPFRFSRRATAIYPKVRECGGMVWDDTPETHPSDEVWNYEEVAKTVRYECENPECKRRFHNSEKLALIRSIEPVQTNPMALPENVSMHWNEMYMAWPQCDWDKIVIKFLRAMNAAKRGDKEPLKVFVQESLGEPWVDEDTAIRELPVSDVDSPGDGRIWSKQDYIFAGIDVQHGHFWICIIAYAKTGEEFVAYAARLVSWEELQEQVSKHNVPPKCVFVDASFHKQDVIVECTRRGWTACYGSDRESFGYVLKKGKDKGKKINLPYKYPHDMEDPCVGLSTSHEVVKELRGKRCLSVVWSNLWIKDIRQNRREDMSRGKMSIIGKNVCADFQKHLYAEHKVLHYDNSGHEFWRHDVIGKRPDHLGDCYCMCTLGACLVRVIGDGVPQEELN